MADIDRIKEKLAKLLRLGENQAATDGEIANALEKATELMARHQLTRDDIDLDAADPIARVKLGRHFGFCKGSKATAWECRVANFVCDFIGSVSNYQTGRIPIRKNGIASIGVNEGEVRLGTAYAFYGCDDDARCAAELFEELRDTIVTMAIVRWGGWAKGPGGTYATGFARGLEAAREQAVLKLKNTDETTHGLILKGEANQLAIVNKATDWLSTEHKVKLKNITFKGPALTRETIAAFQEGKRDGTNYKPDRPDARHRLA